VRNTLHELVVALHRHGGLRALDDFLRQRVGPCRRHAPAALRRA
jgi:hypothetical protein